VSEKDTLAAAARRLRVVERALDDLRVWGAAMGRKDHEIDLVTASYRSGVARLCKTRDALWDECGRLRAEVARLRNALRKIRDYESKAVRAAGIARVALEDNDEQGS